MLKFLIVLLALAASFASSEASEVQSMDASDISVPRLFGKTFNLVKELYKIFVSTKSTEKIDKRINQDLVPNNGLNFYQNPSQNLVTFNGADSMSSVFDNFSKQIDLAFITRVLLKIIIFKKIIKFIVLIFLFFFVPTLNSYNSTDDHSKDGKSFDIYDQVDYRSKEILTFVIQAIEGFSLDHMVWCVGEHDIFCRFQLMFDSMDQSYTIDHIIQNWYPKAAPAILKVIDKLKLPNVTSTTTEAYLQVPGESEEYEIEVSDDDLGEDSKENDSAESDGEDL